MLNISDGVDLWQVSPQIILALLIADQQNSGRYTIVVNITHDSCDLSIDGHSSYKVWIGNIKNYLGPNYEIILGISYISIKYNPRNYIEK